MWEDRAAGRGRLYVLTRVFASPIQDNSGTIERDEFLSLPQISSNPLATRSVRTSFLRQPPVSGRRDQR